MPLPSLVSAPVTAVPSIRHELATWRWPVDLLKQVPALMIIRALNCHHTTGSRF
jgi:hypothetical protein